MKFAYCRVSSLSQTLDSQKSEMPSDIDRIYEEKVSGAKTENREQLNAMLLNIRQDDSVWVFSLDRLARSCKDLLNIVDTITNKGGTIYFKKENLTFSPKDKNNFMNNFLLGVLASFAEWERENIRFRQRIGIEIAKKNGVYRGKQPKLKAEQVSELKNLFNTSRISISNLAKQFHLSRASVYRYLKA